MRADIPSRYRVQNAEVLHAASGLTITSQADIEWLKELASANPRKRVRLCAHQDPSESVHEMLIVHGHDAYVRPHRHPGKTESMHVVEGGADLVLFSEQGEIQGTIQLGDYGSGDTFYHRMATPIFHMLVIRSDVLVFQETTNGPFDRSQTVFADWAPDGSDAHAAIAYLADLRNRLAVFRSAPATNA